MMKDMTTIWIFFNYRYRSIWLIDFFCCHTLASFTLCPFHLE
jgi:hypothetical protein